MPTEECQSFRSFPDSKREAIIQEGVNLYQVQQKPNFSHIKQFLNEKYRTNVCLGTIHNSASGEHQSAQAGHAVQQLLSSMQEDVLMEWIIHLANTGHCISKRTVQKKAKLLSGHKP